MPGGASIVSLGSFSFQSVFGMIASSVLIMQQQFAGKFTVISLLPFEEGLSPHISYKVGDSRPMVEARCSSERNTGISPIGIIATPPIWNIDILWPPRDCCLQKK